MSCGADGEMPRLASVTADVVMTVRVPVSGGLSPERSVAEIRARIAAAAVKALFAGMLDLEPELMGEPVVMHLRIGAQDLQQG